MIRDEGPGFDTSKLPDPTDPANLEKCSGRGLLLMRAFMAEVRHNDRGQRSHTRVAGRRAMGWGCCRRPWGVAGRARPVGAGNAGRNSGQLPRSHPRTATARNTRDSRGPPHHPPGGRTAAPPGAGHVVRAAWPRTAGADPGTRPAVLAVGGGRPTPGPPRDAGARRRRTRGPKPGGTRADRGIRRRAAR